MTTNSSPSAGGSDPKVLVGFIVLWTLGALLGLEDYVNDGNMIGLLVGGVFLLMALVGLRQLLRQRLSSR